MPPQPWTIVLAAGDGRRLAGVTDGVPKQFWSPGDGPTLLQETLSRFEPIASRDRTVLVVARAHDRYAAAMPSVAHLISQPANRGTAAGVLLGLTPALAAAPDDLVIVTPCDHAVLDAARFTSGLIEALDAIRARRTNDVIIFGVAAAGPVGDYGWIVPAEGADNGSRPPLRRVTAFVEKPEAIRAASLYRAGALWNTMILVARARAIERLYRLYLPDVAEVFARYRQLPPDTRDAWLSEQYTTLKSSDLSRDVLSRSRDLFLYSWPHAMGWSDLGTPGRLSTWLTGGKAWPDGLPPDLTERRAVPPEYSHRPAGSRASEPARVPTSTASPALAHAGGSPAHGGVHRPDRFSP